MNEPVTKLRILLDRIRELEERNETLQKIADEQRGRAIDAEERLRCAGLL